MVDFGIRYPPIDHAPSHENAGSDEISLAGLSGELATDQPPKAHDLAGAIHNADTLADLNAKVSNATLDDSGDARTPSAHKTSHQDGGSDEIAATGLVGRINYVDRGDPSSVDWNVGDFTTDETFRDLDCSSIVPAGATTIAFNCDIKDDAAASIFGLRKNGNSNGPNTPTLVTQVANVPVRAILLVSCDANRVVEYWGSNVAFIIIDVLVIGWFI